MNHAEFLRDFVRPTPGPVLVVGSRIEGPDDWRERHPSGTGLDMRSGPGVDIVHDMERPLMRAQLYGHIECTSVIEHTPRPWLMCAEIENLLRPGGSLYFHAPFIWRWHGYPADYWRITHQALPVLFPNINWIRVEYIDGGGESRQAPGFDEPYKMKKVCQEKWHLTRSQVVAFGVMP